jgi:hypothetical protein
VPFDKNEESPNKHKYNPNVFYSMSDNLRGWYYKDKIKYVLIFSELFKTKEQVGVGSTLESVQKIFGKLNINVGSLTGEPEPYPITFNLKPYPQILFILDIEDCKAFIPWEGDWDNIDWDSYEKSMHYRSLELLENTTLSVNDFKKNSKIKTIIVGNSY